LISVGLDSYVIKEQKTGHKAQVLKKSFSCSFRKHPRWGGEKDACIEQSRK